MFIDEPEAYPRPVKSTRQIWRVGGWPRSNPATNPGAHLRDETHRRKGGHPAELRTALLTSRQKERRISTGFPTSFLVLPSLAAEFEQARSDPSETPSHPVSIRPDRRGLPAARAIPFTLDFGGLQNNEQVLSFYNGGTGSLGSGPGTNYGVFFNPTFVAVYRRAALRPRHCRPGERHIPHECLRRIRSSVVLLRIPRPTPAQSPAQSPDPGSVYIMSGLMEPVSRSQ